LNVYRLDAATGTLTANDPPAMKMKPGDGPRHFTFDPKGRFAYVINEISSTVTALKWDGNRGVLTSIESVSTLPADFHGENSTAEVQVHPSGKWLYGSNRGHDSIAVFAIDRNTGKLKLVQNAPTGGSQPRNFRIDPSGKWLIAANHKGNNIRLFRINSKTGQLTPSGEMLQLNSPVCIRFLAIR
jgi:6-phosphogluconolactonase